MSFYILHTSSLKRTRLRILLRNTCSYRQFLNCYLRAIFQQNGDPSWETNWLLRLIKAFVHTATTGNNRMHPCDLDGSTAHQRISRPFCHASQRHGRTRLLSCCFLVSGLNLFASGIRGFAVLQLLAQLIRFSVLSQRFLSQSWRTNKSRPPRTHSCWTRWLQNISNLLSRINLRNFCLEILLATVVKKIPHLKHFNAQLSIGYFCSEILIFWASFWGLKANWKGSLWPIRNQLNPHCTETFGLETLWHLPMKVSYLCLPFLYLFHKQT